MASIGGRRPSQAMFRSRMIQRLRCRSNAAGIRALDDLDLDLPADAAQCRL